MRSPFGLKEKDKLLINAVKSCQPTLDLRGQHLTTIPQCITQKPLLYTLQSLELSYNGFIELPPALGDLVNLQELYLQHNSIELLPDELGNLVNLKRLGLAHNKLNDVPLYFGKFRQLEWLNISGNAIEVVPVFLLRIPRLKYLYLLCNPIENIPRDVYIQSLAVIRQYFNVVVKEEPEAQPSQSVSFTNELLENIRNRKKNKEKSKKDHKEKTSVKTDNSFEGCSGKVNYHVSHYEKISEVVKSQKEQLQLVKDLKEKIRLNQEIRRLNLEYLQKQIQRKTSRSMQRLRRMSDLSLDSGQRERRRRRIATSEYGSLSTFTGDNNGIIPYDDSSDDDGASIVSFESEVSMKGSVSSDNDATSCDLEEHCNGNRHITHGDICVIIPEYNHSGHFKSEFFLEIIEDFSQQPPVKSREMVASEILRLGPHGALFFRTDPAIISLPFDACLSSGDQVICMCSDTGLGETPKWEPINKTQYKVFDSHVEINAYHFSLFAVVIQKGYPRAQRLIRKGVGGCLYIPEVPGVEVNFPETSLLHDIEASVKVLYSDDPYDVDHNDPEAFALATPVVELGPHGCQFNPDTKDPVTIRLPLPNAKEIMSQFGGQQLTFWTSSTLEGEPPVWQQFHPKSVYIDTEDPTLCSVYFSVEHFTLFRALWDTLDAIVYEAKIGASHFVPIFQFYVSCQALMSESEDGVRFGICVACCRFGKPLEGIGNFPIAIGTHPPKMISTGPITIRVMSGLFKADTAAGQQNLEHTETFTGRQMVVQFICCFTGEIPAHGSFGKAEIEQTLPNGRGSTLFSFNLDKPRDAIPYQSSLQWDVQLSRELASLLTITTERDMGDEVWEEIAKALRYTQAEITKLAASTEPMTELLANYKRRGGQPHEFISAMYSIGQYRNRLHGQPRMIGPGSSAVALEEERGESSTSEPRCPCVKKNERKRKLPPEISWEDKFVEITGKLTGRWKDLGRVLRMEEPTIQEIELNYKQDGVREQAYQMLLAWREKYPDNCSLQTLSNALCKIGLGYVARQCCMVEMG
ncbi:uncharacterized protein LOC116616958 [Nematostella vectensis]|uniref:uncharacterized protein LOC116616958 n=1 Tax=Nematostella vectensis TaxID=45351 RepID=UPI002077283F|nr:uncharacterized protein LOC116616958 [Nematostella vectensis]